MLKLSYMARAQDHDTYDGLVAFAKKIELDMIDFHVMGTLQERGFLRDLKYKCLRAGLPIGYFASGVSLVGPAEQRSERLARAKGDTDAAAALRARHPGARALQAYIGVYGTPVGVLPLGVDP